jgi:hypothetical protein
MLTQFLLALQNGEMQSLLQIARSLGVSSGMVLQLARDLTERGYLQEIGPDCETLQNSCTDCPVTSNCHVIGRHWFLTEKGKHALAVMAGSGLPNS